MFIDKIKNQNDKAAILLLKNIVNSAFNRGFKEFHTGQRKAYDPTVLQVMDLSRRFELHEKSKPAFERLTSKILEQGYTLHDSYDGETLVNTVMYVTTVADNPYATGSLYAQEWERGFNAAFTRNTKKKANKR